MSKSEFPPSIPWNFKEELYEKLRDPEYASFYLNEAFFDDDEIVLKGAIEAVVHAHGVVKVAKKAGINRCLFFELGYGLRSNLVPAQKINIDEAQMLVKEGINVVAGRTAGRSTVCGSTTLARDGQMDNKFSSLTVTRLCLEITNTIDLATRWTVFAANTTAVAERVNSLVHAYMCSLAAAGAFTDDMFVVQCDAGLHSSPVNKDRGVTVLLAFHPADADDPVSLTLHQTIAGCRVATTAFAPVFDECA